MFQNVQNARNNNQSSQLGEIKISEIDCCFAKPVERYAAVLDNSGKNTPPVSEKSIRRKLTVVTRSQRANDLRTFGYCTVVIGPVSMGIFICGHSYLFNLSCGFYIRKCRSVLIPVYLFGSPPFANLLLLSLLALTLRRYGRFVHAI